MMGASLLDAARQNGCESRVEILDSDALGAHLSSLQISTLQLFWGPLHNRKQLFSLAKETFGNFFMKTPAARALKLSQKS
jgi:hypothetical protein